MGTPPYAIPVLEALLSLEHTLVGAYTQPDSLGGRGRVWMPPPVKSFALEHGIPVFQPPSLRLEDVQRDLAALLPDLVVVAAYGKILPPQVLNIPPHGCVNVHPSLLPRNRGPSPVASAILDGEEFTGTTIILMDEGMDTGPILSSRAVPIRSGIDTTETLTPVLFQLGGDLLKEGLPLWLNGTVIPRVQDHGEATTTKKLEKGDGEATWDIPAEALERRLRAYTPWPGLFTYWKGRLIKILSAAGPLPYVEGPRQAIVEEAIPRSARDELAQQGEHGLVVPLDEPGSAVGVVTAQGVLALRTLQMEGRRPTSSGEFVRGYRDFVGSRLPS